MVRIWIRTPGSCGQMGHHPGRPNPNPPWREAESMPRSHLKVKDQQSCAPVGFGVNLPGA